MAELGKNLAAPRDYTLTVIWRSKRAAGKKGVHYSGSCGGMAMRRWYLQDGRLPSQASPAGKRPVLIFKERAPIAVVSLAVLAVPVASEGLRTLRHHVRRAQHLPKPGFTNTGE